MLPIPGTSSVAHLEDNCAAAITHARPTRSSRRCPRSADGPTRLRRVPVLPDRVDRDAPEYAARRESLLELLAEHSRQLALAEPRRRREVRQRHRDRGKLLARERVELLLDPDSPFLELSPLAGWGTPYTVGASIVTGIGVVEGTEVMVVATTRRCAAERSTLSPPAAGPGAADREREPAALGQPGRVRRRRPADTERDIHPGRRRLPGPDPKVGGGDPDGRAGVRQLDRRWRLHTRHERLRRDGRGPGEGLPRRAAAGQDGHRRGRPATRSSAVPRCTRAPAGSPTTSRSTRWRRSGSAGRSSAGSTGASSDRPPAVRHRAALRHRRPGRHRADRPARAVRPARRARADPRRQRVRRVQAVLRVVARHRVRPAHGYPIGVLANARGVLFAEESEEGRRSSSSSRTRPTRRCCSCRTPPATWWARTTSSAGSSRPARR